METALPSKGHCTGSATTHGVAALPVKNATKILLDSVDYFTILLTGISGIFVNNLPLSSQIIFLTVGEEDSARFLGYFAIFGRESPESS